MAAMGQVSDNQVSDNLVGSPFRLGLRFSLRLVLLGILALAAGLAIWGDSLWVRYMQLRAENLFQEYRDAEALQMLRRTLLVDPANPQSLLALARAHRRDGNLQKAMLFVSQAQSMGGDPERIELERKLVMVQAGRIRESGASPASLLMHANELGPDVLQAFVLGYFANLRTEEAGQLLDRWLESSPHDAQAYFLKAYLQKSLNQFSQAIEYYRRGLELAPHKTRMRRQLCEALLENDELEAANQELAICRSETSDDVELDFLQAQHAYRQSDLQRASELLDQVIERSPEQASARRLRGRIRLEQGRLDAAQDDLQLLVAAEPTDTVARESLGRALQQLGDRDAAEEHFQFVSQATQVQSEVTRLIRQTISQPDDAELRFRIGRLINDFISPEDAARWMRTVLELKPDHPGAHAALAQYFEQRGDRFHALLHRQQLASSPVTPSPQAAGSGND
jgi:tetratricopeptide (TPR) repeat protein